MQSALLGTVFAALAIGQWGSGSGGSCSPLMLHDPAYKWEPVPAAPGQYFLRRDGVFVGGWDSVGQRYLPWSGGRWGNQCAPPVPPPDLTPLAPVNDLPTGVDPDKIGPDGIFHHGEQISREHALDLITQKIPDDSHKGRLTFVLEPTQLDVERQRVSQFLQDANLVEHVIPWFAAVGDPILRQRGFPVDEPGQLFIQQPDGKVIEHWKSYDLERDRPVLRWILDQFNPNVDRDSRGLLLWLLGIDPSVLWIGGGILVLLLLRRQQQ